jgi:hypothetical protein
LGLGELGVAFTKDPLQFGEISGLLLKVAGHNRTCFFYFFRGNPLPLAFEAGLHLLRHGFLCLGQGSLLLGNWDITEKSDPFLKTNAQEIEFRIPLKPEETHTITYKVHYSW